MGRQNAQPTLSRTTGFACSEPSSTSKPKRSAITTRPPAQVKYMSLIIFNKLLRWTALRLNDFPSEDLSRDNNFDLLHYSVALKRINDAPSIFPFIIMTSRSGQQGQNAASTSSHKTPFFQQRDALINEIAVVRHHFSLSSTTTSNPPILFPHCHLLLTLSLSSLILGPYLTTTHIVSRRCPAKYQ